MENNNDLPSLTPFPIFAALSDFHFFRENCFNLQNFSMIVINIPENHYKLKNFDAL